MAQNLKHVGRIAKTGKKCLVVFRTLPADAFNSLVILTESLPDSYHDALISLVEGNAAQSANEFAEVLARAVFPDGTTMLPSLHARGMLVKVGTDQIEMTPNSQAVIKLSELNQLIAEQKGVSVQDLAIADNGNKTEIKEVATARDLTADELKAPKEPDVAKTTSASVNEEAETPSGSPEDQAKFYRSQADRLSKQAAEMRRKAEELVPTKKKATATA